MKRRTLLGALCAFALSLAAFASFWSSGNPPGLRDALRGTLSGVRDSVSTRASPHIRADLGVRPVRTAPRPRPAAPPAPTLSWSAPVVGLRAIALDGATTDLGVPPDLDLRQPLPVPPGTADLELTFGGPLVLSAVTPTGRIVRSLDLPTLLVALDDPDSPSGAVVLDLDATLAARLDLSDAALTVALGDAACAVAW